MRKVEALEEPKQMKTVGSGRLWANTAGEELLEFLGLGTLSAVEEFSGGEVVSAGSHRFVRKVIGPHGQIVYLKQSFRASGGGLIQSVLKRGSRYSGCRSEAFNLLRLGRDGFSCAPVLAFGEELRGLSEGFSFLLTRAVEGSDFEAYLTGSMPGFLRTAAHDVAVVSSLIDLSIRLVNQGLYFQDLVPKHIYLSLAENGVIALSLIDVARLDVAKPRSVSRAARMLAKLNANLPLAEVGHTSRSRFVRSVEKGTNLSLFAATFEETERLLIKRRYRFILSPKKRPPVSHLFRSRNGTQAWDENFIDSQKLAQIDADPRETFDFAKLDPGSKAQVVAGSFEDIKLLVNLHSALFGWVKNSPLVGWEIDSQENRPSWAAYCPVEAPWLAEFLPTIPDSEMAILAHDLGQVLSALLQVGVLPENGLLGWFKWHNGSILAEFKPPFRTKDLSADNLEIQLAEELAVILGSIEGEKVAQMVSTARKGLLGCDLTLVR